MRLPSWKLDKGKRTLSTIRICFFNWTNRDIFLYCSTTESLQIHVLYKIGNLLHLLEAPPPPNKLAIYALFISLFFIHVPEKAHNIYAKCVYRVTLAKTFFLVYIYIPQEINYGIG